MDLANFRWLWDVVDYFDNSVQCWKVLGGLVCVMLKSGINKQKRIFQISSLRSDIPLSNLLENIYCYIY